MLGLDQNIHDFPDVKPKIYIVTNKDFDQK